MAKQLVGKEYADMSEGYQGRVSEDTFNRRQKAQRMAGDALKDTTASERNKGIYDVTDLKDFDLTAGGRGGTTGGGAYSDGGTANDSSDDTFGKGRGRFSRQDAKKLFNGGNFSAQELMDYGNNLDESKDQIFGGKAQRFLQSKLGEITTPDKPGVTPDNPTPKPGDDADRGVPNVDISLPGTGEGGSGNATNINVTDNDVISNNSGDNAVITQKVDNSVSQQAYGGSTYDYTFNPGKFYPIPYRARGLDLY